MILMCTDTQLVLMSAAARRDNHLITPKETLKGRAAEIALTAMIKKGLANAVMATLVRGEHCASAMTARPSNMAHHQSKNPVSSSLR
jgi:hypothetical protein